MVKIPEIKKTIHAFLSKEDGKISKEKLLKTGIVLGAIALGGLKSVSGAPTEKCPPDPCNNKNIHCNVNSPISATNGDTIHNNNLLLNYADPIVKGSHNHGYSQHCSHGSHGSHGSHCSWMC
jgi:hypothetical protein